MRPVDAGLRQWIADKKARSATYDLPQQAASLPRYLAPSGVERWRCLRRLVTAASCRRPVCAEQAATLAAGDSTATAAVDAAPGAGQPRGSKAGVGSDADDVESLSYYRGKRPPRSANFTLARPGDELIALECLRGYQRALACHTKRALQEKPAAAASAGPALAARLDIRLGKVLLESSVKSRATTVSPRPQQPSAVVLPPPTSSQPPTGRGGAGAAATRPSTATLAASSKAASPVASPEPSAASDDDDSGSRGGTAAAGAGTGATARHVSAAVPLDACRLAAAAAAVPLRGGTLDVSYSEKEARLIPRWARSSGGGGGGGGRERALLPCRRVRVWKATQCGLSHAAGCFGQRLLEKFTWLSMLDLSWNRLERVPEGLSVLASLRILYLHSNEIGAYDSLAVLSRLRGLSALTLHGNPLEAGSNNKQQVLQHTRTYKSSVLAILPRLKTLDHSTVTKSDASPK